MVAVVERIIFFTRNNYIILSFPVFQTFYIKSKIVYHFIIINHFSKEKNLHANLKESVKSLNGDSCLSSLHSLATAPRNAVTNLSGFIAIKLSSCSSKFLQWA